MRDQIARLLLITLTALAGCGGDEPDTSRTEPTSSAPTVRTRTLESAVLDGVIHATGHLSAHRDVLMASEVRGLVRERPIEEGAAVESGAVILRIDDTTPRLDFENAQSAMLEVETSPSMPGTERDRRRLALEMARDRLSRFTIRAPWTGTIESLEVDVGDLVVPGSPVARIVDPNDLRIILALTDAEIVKVAKGDEASVSVDALPDRELRAEVIRIGAAADARTGRIEVELKITLDGPPVKPGMFARAEIRVAGGQGIMIPRNATFSRFEEVFAFVTSTAAGAEFLIEERRLRVHEIPGSLDAFAVVSGLQAGETLVLGPLLGLRAGMKVKVANGQ